MRCGPCPRSGSRRRSAILLVLNASAIALTGCYASGPSVVLVPAAPGETEPVRIAEEVRAHVWITMADGQVVRSRQRVPLPAGGWYHWYDPGATIPVRP